MYLHCQHRAKVLCLMWLYYIVLYISSNNVCIPWPMWLYCIVWYIGSNKVFLPWPMMVPSCRQSLGRSSRVSSISLHVSSSIIRGSWAPPTAWARNGEPCWGGQYAVTKHEILRAIIHSIITSLLYESKRATVLDLRYYMFFLHVLFSVIHGKLETVLYLTASSYHSLQWKGGTASS